jgi:hypothetical protein
MLIRHSLLTLAAAALALCVVTIPAQADPATELAPTGCSVWTEWVHSGTSHYYGKGNVACAAGRYAVKNFCRNQQTGEGYVVYGPALDAPNQTTVTCFPGNTAESVHAVEDPPPPYLTGCVTWIETINDGTNYYNGRAKAQCDSGVYKAQVLCRNFQTGHGYIINTNTAAARDVATANCATGNVVESITAVPSSDPPSDPGPWGVQGPVEDESN